MTGRVRSVILLNRTLGSDIPALHRNLPPWTTLTYSVAATFTWARLAWVGSCADSVEVLHRRGDLGEVIGLERGSADQAAVDIGLGDQFGRVARLHRAAVLDPGRSRDRLAVELRQQPFGQFSDSVLAQASC